MIMNEIYNKISGTRDDGRNELMKVFSNRTETLLPVAWREDDALLTLAVYALSPRQILENDLLSEKDLDDSVTKLALELFAATIRKPVEVNALSRLVINHTLTGVNGVNTENVSIHDEHQNLTGVSYSRRLKETGILRNGILLIDNETFQNGGILSVNEKIVERFFNDDAMNAAAVSCFGKTVKELASGAGSMVTQWAW